MKKKQEYRGIPPQESSSRSSCSHREREQHKGLVKQNPTSACGLWAVPGGAHRELLHTGVFQCFPFGNWAGRWICNVSHPRQTLSPAERFHSVLKTPQLLPQQPWLLPLPTGEHKALGTRGPFAGQGASQKTPRSSPSETEPTSLTLFFDSKLKV